MDSDSELKLISLITQLMSLEDTRYLSLVLVPTIISLIIQIIRLVRSMDLDSQPKPESELMSLIKQTITLFNSIDLDSQPEPLSKLISLITQLVDFEGSDSEWEKKQFMFPYLLEQTSTSNLESEAELMSLIHQIFRLVISMNSKGDKLISLSPQVIVSLEKGKFRVLEGECGRNSDKLGCLPLNWEKFELRKGEDANHFLCRGCYGKNHEEYEKAPVQIKHPLHPKHSLQLVFAWSYNRTKECYCCDEDLKSVFYYCSVCDYALNIACLEKQPVLSIDHPKWHEHTLTLFPRQAPLTCDVCALTHSICPFYIYSLCGFVVHQSCVNLPRVIRISRHPHRLSFTPSFGKGDWSCSVCRKKIHNDFGGYSCIKKGCSYGAHSKCATQSNVWDGKDLEGESEEIEDEVEPFVRISDGIIKHFSHKDHHLRLDENTSRDYDESKLCQACITPIYFGNFYSCMQCEFILHEKCANLSRKMHHPIHPHMLTLVERNDTSVMNKVYRCAACPCFLTTGFLYECGKEGCRFKLHVQCTTISEPLVHGSHMHPLFLTSKPGEMKRICSVFKVSIHYSSNETFNCIECECDFAMCFECATIPQKVRYKHDKHILTLSYGEDTSTVTSWCEACERKIDLKERFYMCGEYCCITLHVECLLGYDLYMKPDSSWLYLDKKVDVLHNNHHMSRPICYYCKKRCPYKIVFQSASGSIFCRLPCLLYAI